MAITFLILVSGPGYGE